MLEPTVFAMRVVGEDGDEPKIDTSAEIVDTLGRLGECEEVATSAEAE